MNDCINTLKHPPILSKFPEAQRMRAFRSPVKLSTQLQHEIYQSLQTIRVELIPQIAGYCYARLIDYYHMFPLWISKESVATVL